jgi:hypothetical protein
MKYKKGDKVVVEITEVDEKDKELTYGVGNPTWIRSKYILGKLENFTKSKKIKFSEAEKAEFDELNKTFSTPLGFFNEIIHSSGMCNLWSRLFKNTVEKNAIAQFEFIKAIEHPELVEVVKEKKYRLKFLGGYIAYDSLMNTYDFWKNIVNKPRIYHFNFTQSEIDKMQKLPKFQAIDLNKFKEEVEDE